LWANGIQNHTLQYLKSCYDKKEKVSETVHETLCKLFYSYLVVGGMPETVQIYVDTHDIAKVVLNQRSILDLYRLDIAKYATENEKIKIKAIFDSIPAQLNEKNRRFKLNSINASARHIRYEDSFNWLADAGVALPCYNVTEPQAPLQLSEKRNLFKLYMNDVGLLCASCMENIQFDLLMGNVDVNMGSILENAFAQNLKSNGFELHYYDSKKIGELDFVLQKGLHTELVEIKSGNDFKKHLAMDHAMKVEQWKFEKNIVFSKSNVEEDGEILYLPWYMILFYKQEREPEKMIYEIDLSGLV
jgi:predicted AAA+ superfamily ATPase